MNTEDLKNISIIDESNVSDLIDKLDLYFNIVICVMPTSLGDRAPYIYDSWGKVLHDPFENNNMGIRFTPEEAKIWAVKYAVNNLIKD